MARFVVAEPAEIRFPDACLVTARPKPGTVTRVRTTGLGSWLSVLVGRSRPGWVDVPVVPRIARRLRLRRYVTTGVLLLIVALGTAAVVEASSSLWSTVPAPDSPPWWAWAFITGLVLTGWLILEAARPPSIDVVRRRGRLCVTIRQRALAFQAARMNGAEIVARG
jgi:hypothetical protein